MLYGDVLWMMGVTITNLGYGDFTPSNYISRIIISILSLLGKLFNSICSVDSNVVLSGLQQVVEKLKGILQTALIVGVLSETLIIPPDEKCILASVDGQSEFLN